MNATSKHGPAEHVPGPSGPGSVILELGGDIGALIVEAPPALAGQEIEISLRADGPRTHSVVRQRDTGAGRSYAAVYPVVPAGEYTVWRDDGVPAGQVTVRGGRAGRFAWPEVTPAGPG